ncbi:purine and uridine phosphorylase [Phellopilus nigrolimitatus]|nr:purine and uridine phosphorylase [Phellopilus nigrolimitatus]
MSYTFTDASALPRTADGRVYHLGLRRGEVANRILTVGSPSRAEAIAELLDGSESEVFKLSSERGFLTITGRYNDVPISIVSIGMGYPNMDFFVREVRECVSGDLIIVRLGSCGGLTGLPVGSLVVPSACVAVHRNYDFDFTSDSVDEYQKEQPYYISKPVSADPELHAILAKTLKATASPEPAVLVSADTVNASADSFYSSQGRQTSFPDHNETLVDHLVASVPNLASLEMETFHLLHLAHVWRPHLPQAGAGPPTLPPTRLPVSPAISPAHSAQRASADQTSAAPNSPSTKTAAPAPRIRAAAVQMIFANRRSQEFIDPARVGALEAWSGRATLDALSAFHVPKENLQEENGSVWATK